MKLRLTHSLLALALSAMPGSWAAVIGTGVSYDVGKGSEPYSQNANAHDMGQYPGGEKREDTLLCWATSASNMIQYWQDAYGSYLTTAAPNGFNLNQDGTAKYDQPDGTRYLNVYEKILYASTKDEGGYQDEALNWYFNQEGGSAYLTPKEEEEPYITGTAPTVGSDYFMGEYDVSRLKDELTAAFSKAGQSVGLRVWQQDYGPDMSNWRYHAITCWGFETDSDGNINAMYLTDSDDMEFGVFKVHVSEGETLPTPPTPDWPYPGESYPAIVLSTDDNIDGYNSSFVASLLGTYRLITPDGYTPSDGYDLPVPSLQSTDYAAEVCELYSNTIIDGKVKRTGAGIKVGKGEQGGEPDIVMLVSKDTNSALELESGGTGTGLDVSLGSLASVANLSVSGFERGVDAKGKVYLYGDGDLSDSSASTQLYIHDNTLSAPGENGAGIRNANYVEIEGNDAVMLESNTATGKGGAIYNQDVLSIRGNGYVGFYYNHAQQGGNDIYNAADGVVNISDNGQVMFYGVDASQSAVKNEGSLYLKASETDRPTEGADIVFSDAALDSNNGTTYVGRDIAGSVSATSIDFIETDPETFAEVAALTVTNGSGEREAVLKKLSVDAQAIAGVSMEESFLGNADVESLGNLSLSNLTLDTSSTFASSDGGIVTLDNVVITLPTDTQPDEKGIYTFDLSGMFTDFSQVNFDNVYLDASAIYGGVLPEDQWINVNFNLGDQTAYEIRNISVLLGEGLMTGERRDYDNANMMFYGAKQIPEPTSGTLSLLAFAALAARRRRK